MSIFSLFSLWCIYFVIFASKLKVYSIWWVIIVHPNNYTFLAVYHVSNRCLYLSISIDIFLQIFLNPSMTIFDLMQMISFEFRLEQLSTIDVLIFNLRFKVFLRLVFYYFCEKYLTDWTLHLLFYNSSLWLSKSKV